MCIYLFRNNTSMLFVCSLCSVSFYGVWKHNAIKADSCLLDAANRFYYGFHLRLLWPLIIGTLACTISISFRNYGLVVFVSFLLRVCRPRSHGGSKQTRHTNASGRPGTKAKYTRHDGVWCYWDYIYIYILNL